MFRKAKREPRRRRGRASKLSRRKCRPLSHLILGAPTGTTASSTSTSRRQICETIVKIIMDEMKNDEAIDAPIRKKLETQKRIVEGSDEWDVLYRKVL